jgi:hypothetical protein
VSAQIQTIYEDVEEWRVFLASPSYEVSSHGRVRRRETGYVRKALVAKRGSYLVVGLWENGAEKLWPVHQIVCLTFHGPRPTPKHDAAHNDGKKPNCHRDNIAWKTRAENEADKVLHGTSNRGERNGMAKLTDAQTAEIIRLAGPKPPPGRHRRRGALAAIAARFGITKGCIHLILWRRGL